MARRQLLPQQPHAPDPLQHRLTERFLLSRREALLALFCHARSVADTDLSAAQPQKAGKPYPLGQCLEISRQVLRLVGSWLPASRFPMLPPDAASGLECLRGFLTAGGTMRMVWGDLRGEYFQNAFQLGALYVDVANDTVVPEKPPVEILSFEESGLVAIRDFFHFAAVAKRYWKARLYPNHVFPRLAPYFPWISLTPETGPRLQAGNDFMIELTRRDGFRSAQAVLQKGSIPPALRAGIESLGLDQRLGHVKDGRKQALAHCDHLRLVPPDDTQRDSVVRQFLEVNRQLARIRVEQTRPAR